MGAVTDPAGEAPKTHEAIAKICDPNLPGNQVFIVRTLGDKTRKYALGHPDGRGGWKLTSPQITLAQGSHLAEQLALQQIDVNERPNAALMVACTLLAAEHILVASAKKHEEAAAAPPAQKSLFLHAAMQDGKAEQT